MSFICQYGFLLLRLLDFISIKARIARNCGKTGFGHFYSIHYSSEANYYNLTVLISTCLNLRIMGQDVLMEKKENQILTEKVRDLRGNFCN